MVDTIDKEHLRGQGNAFTGVFTERRGRTLSEELKGSIKALLKPREGWGEVRAGSSRKALRAITNS